MVSAAGVLKGRLSLVQDMLQLVSRLGAGFFDTGRISRLRTTTRNAREAGETLIT
jgi:hypothetical protein